MNTKELNSLATRLPDSIPKLAVALELNKLVEWQNKCPPRSIERAYIDAHFAALKGLVDRALEEK